ncbi:acetyl-CoA C-acyltransferase [Chryseotalea sanaruensis]|uniref:Acetyl-CoA C-acyltransferase n=1 Tax=Chryseotalea sanaruensis TaxID=2482724 RepID=A0A401U715_9BACT|nr:acetyl-CoA C-acyltransferase [Chryseotalea sanaruensis]GCC50685.1 acetyl-CoA C-acyltransferase [Chryseotalea sanaruensis]
MKSVYIVDIVRTPIGKYAGSLAAVRPDDLAAWVIKRLVERNPTVDFSLIEDVVFGAANQSGEDNRNVARMAALLSGLPVEVGGVTVNRLCASGLQAIMDASRAIMLGEGEAYLAGGVESMSRAPFVMAKAEEGFSRKTEIYDTTMGWRFTNPALSKLYHPFTMGETAENVAAKWKVSREAQDEFAYQSQVRYAKAHEAGKFNDELVSVLVPKGKNDPLLFDKDEHPRVTSIEKLAALKPAFKEGGTVTAGNSSGINDGAAVSLLVNEDVVKRFNLKPKARVVTMAIAGVDPAYMGVGPVPAVNKVLKRAGLKIQDIGLVELNEAFASQSLACMQDLNLNPDIVNVNGGSIAIGHPLGCSGVRISATLIHEMQKREVRYGIATMCIGVGQGSAILYEKI